MAREPIVGLGDLRASTENVEATEDRDARALGHGRLGALNIPALPIRLAAVDEVRDGERPARAFGFIASGGLIANLAASGAAFQ